MPTTDYKRDERLQVIHKCLKNAQAKWSVKKLLEKVNSFLAENFGKVVSARTIADDLKYLTEKKFAPVKIIKEGKQVYYSYDDFSFELNVPQISKDQFLSLVIAKEVLAQLKGFPLIQDLEMAVTALEHSISDNREENYNYLLFESASQLKNIALLEDLLESIKEKTVLRIEYKNFNSDVSMIKIVHPYFLKQYNQRWFLFGYDELNKRLDNSPLDRIINLKPLSNPFIKDHRIDPKEYFKNIIGVTKLADAKLERIVFTVSKERADYIITKPIHSSQKIIRIIKDKIEFEISVIINKELVSLLLSFGKDINIKHPKFLIEILKNELEESLKNYSSRN